MRCRFFLTVVFLGLLAACLVVSAQAAGQIEIINLKNTTADQLVDTLRPLLDDGEVVSPAGNRVIVKASAARMHQIRELIQQLDTRPRQLRITAKRDGNSRHTRRNANIDGVIDAGDVDVIVGQPVRRGTEITIGDQTTQRQDQRTQHITVLEGYAARLSRKKWIPVAQRSAFIGRGQLVIIDGVQYLEVDAGLEVVPRVTGNRVILQVKESVVDNNPGQAPSGSSITSQVSGQLGQWIDLGGIQQQGSSRSAGVAGYDAASGVISESVQVRVDALESGAR